jgi:hypothetical protein
LVSPDDPKPYDAEVDGSSLESAFFCAFNTPETLSVGEQCPKHPCIPTMASFPRFSHAYDPKRRGVVSKTPMHCHTGFFYSTEKTLKRLLWACLNPWVIF